MEHTTRRILIVDDNTDLARSYRDLLSLEGYSVQTAASGEEALQALAEGEMPELILIDCVMPGLSGADFVRALGQRLPHVRQRALLVGFSSFLPGTPMLRELERVLTRVVEKPQDVDELLNLVHESLPPPAGIVSRARRANS